jgi:transmembrane protein 231
MLKWGWVQFVATFWVVWWLLSWVEGLVFQFRVLETRVISDIQTRQQKY